MLTSKKGISALQIHRIIGSGSYNTAFYMCHRLRAAMNDPEFRQLMGIVEVDETYIGGKDKNRHWDKKQRGRGTGGKTPVIGAISRKGNVVCKMIETYRYADAAPIRRARPSVTRLIWSRPMSIPAICYLDRWRNAASDVVAHSKGEYVRGNVHTQNIESFWSLLKRGIIGTYHNVSKKYLPLYLAEFSFRFNNRNEPDIFGKAIAGS